MTQLTTTPEGFRTAAYLAARARLDAARTRSRSGKTSRSVNCNPPNVRCGGRCIPPSWDCRLKGEGPDPHLRAVKTDPLSGFANIQRGIGRITKGVTRGNLSEVQGGRAAIIRGVVKTVPGDIQQKKQLKTTLENRTRAIGIGLAVVTTGLGMHAILMEGNIRYREGVGKNINNSIRLGVNKVLDATPIVGANRARVATRAASGINAELTRQRNPVSAELTNQLAKTKPSPIDEAGQANLVRNLTAVNKDPSRWMRARGGPESSFNAWDRAHQNAFWSTKKVDKSYGESSIFARPATDEFLARQFNLQGDDVLTSAAVKDAVERNLTSYKNDLIDLAQQQGFKVDKTSAGGRSINKEGRRAFIQAQVRTTLPLGQSNDRVRAALTKHLEQTLTQSPSTRANGVYKETFDGFNEFYTAKAGVIESATAEPRISAEMRKTGAAETLFNARQARASFVSGKDVKGPSHAELVLRQYFEQSVAGNPRRMFTVTDRLASAAASEIEGRNVGPAEAFRVLEREGISGAVPQRTTAAPRSSAGLASQASLSSLARSIRARAGNENMSMEASLRQARAELANRGDSADLPTRVRSYLEARRDFKEGGRLGKPCGESHIPKAHECRKGRGAQAAPQSGVTADRLKAAATGALVAGLAVGGTAAFRNRQTLAMGSIRALSGDGIKQGLAKVPARFREPVRNLVGRTKTAVAGVLMVSKGSKLIDVDNLNNMATFSLRNGDLVSVSNVGDTLVMFRTHPHNTIDYGGGETAGRYVVDFTVDLSHKQTKQDRKQALGIARKTKTMFGKQMSYVPDNSFVTAEALGTDGLGNKRGGIYQKYGFQPIGDISTHLWGIKSKGEFRKMNQRQTSSLVSVLREQKRVDSAKLANRSDFVAGKKGLGKPCGASHIPKAYECSKGAAGSSSTGNNKTAIIAAVVGGAVAIGVAGAVAYNVKTISDPSKTPLAPSPNIRDVVKAAKTEIGTKSASEAMGHYYVNKSGLKPGDVVYFRSAKDPSAHFGVYLGPGKDGIVRAVIANTKASRFSWSDVTEIGSIKPGVKAKQAVMTPLVKAPTPQFLQGGKGPYTPEEVMRRAIRISNTDYKFSVTLNNCETLANTIAYGVPKSEQLDRFNRASRVMVDVTVGRGQRREGESAIFEGRAQGRSYTAADFSKFLEGERAFSSPEGKNLARQYDTYFKGYNLDARNAPDYLGLISPSELWSSINTYEAPVRAQAMSNYLFALRTLKEMAAS